jgi:6-phosphofructokinase 1
MSKRVAILVGDDDVPGLNKCLKSLVYGLIDEGFEHIGVRKGWQGISQYNPRGPNTYGENFTEYTKAIVRSIDRMHGSFLHASRINPAETSRRLITAAVQIGDTDLQDMSAHIMDVFERLKFEAMVDNYRPKVDLIWAAQEI